jgi:hypothetical protein
MNLQVFVTYVSEAPEYSEYKTFSKLNQSALVAKKIILKEGNKLKF